MLRGMLLSGLGSTARGPEELGSLWDLFPAFRDLGSPGSLKRRFLVSRTLPVVEWQLPESSRWVMGNHWLSLPIEKPIAQKGGRSQATFS